LIPAEGDCVRRTKLVSIILYDEEKKKKRKKKTKREKNIYRHAVFIGPVVSKIALKKLFF